MFAKFAVLLCVAGAILLSQETTAGPIVHTTIIEALRDLIQKVKAIISNLHDLIKNLEDKIFTIISDVNLPETLSGIKDKIDAILEKADVDIQQAQDCLTAEHSAVTTLTKNVVSGVKQCMAYTQEERNKIHEGVRTYIKQGEGLIHDVDLKIKKCVIEHISVPNDFFDCIESIKQSAFDEIIEFVELTTYAIQQLEKDVAGVAVDLAGCIEPVVQQIEVEEAKIISDFETCINKIAHL